jgi:hypothetical protein
LLDEDQRGDSWHTNLFSSEYTKLNVYCRCLIQKILITWKKKQKFLLPILI